MTTATALSINGQRLWDSLMELAKIGATPKGGNCRLALTELDGQGRDLLVRWMREAGLEITVDQVGNIFGRRPGARPELPSVATGSHIDTQPTGGKFDGCFGVLAGLEVMRTLQDHDVRTEAPLELAIWTNEEGTRFVPVMMGSGVFCNIFPLETALSATDVDGKSVRDELARIGYAGDAPVGQRKLGKYFEAHIEQGPILEAEDKVIGVVTGSLGLRWYDVTVTGMEAHAGPTPMPMRRDALYAATHLMQEVVRIALDYAPQGRGTVGVANVYPSSRNVIPGKVSFTVDLRHPDAARLAEMDARLRQACQALGAGDTTGYPVDVDLRDVQHFPPTPFEPALIGAVRQQAEARGYSHMDIVTGAGHDAVYVATVSPTAMIFVPCKDGISHNEVEDADPAHLEAGANVLLGAMLQHAGMVER
ncbi:Zn-dependent hydrolase [Bordetella bronchiseptica]|uniref:Amidohydrolase n=1 Tax=Bordetella bronchiseptica (strain ATCC BAA-588 / NCTC 13252 / RB50) TaxID=257310 RepID=A0A0H3LLZ1_BORBR|nr:Zn-dependent hydrolase [Bordetella bronchiseptica]KAK68067.1 amidase, hydantoinase/carbamoylase family [Bordetella bronchiseptica 980-2]AMG88231.1 Zn-dependent hydrolase [Bordetella bronchiseptica]AWP80810.1 Zn-dependent hydrolase [Bordetella bronchiseptica]AWP85604.1 Zn-dependent hydrolase [Bordetella bronchiseptica]AWQ11182.1 Zn-dependent hydrolase [Bordetella bronchiseptica]